MSDLIASVAAVARRHLPEEARDAPVDRDTDLPGLGLDSVRVVSFLVDVERTFAVSFPDQLVDAATFRTPRAVAEAVRTLRDTG
jgi:acyl carrier protein